MEESSKLDTILAKIGQFRDRLVAVIVHLNDTYLIEERPEQQLPGFARVTATISRLRDHVHQLLGADRTLVLHSGDFLGPSRVGQNTKGSVMVEVLNKMGLHYCVLGNHEFDYGGKILKERLQEAKFGVVLSNVKCESAHLIPCVLWPSEAAASVALTGVVSESVHSAFEKDWVFSSPTDSLRHFAKQTKDVPFHIVLTHADRVEDRAMRDGGFADRTYYLGGHDHDIDWIEADGGPWLLKNESNLKPVRVLLLLAGGTSVWHRRLYPRHNRLLDSRLSFDEVVSSLYRDPSKPIQFSVPKQEYWRHIDSLLQGLNPFDASVVRQYIPTEPPQLTADVASAIQQKRPPYVSVLDAVVQDALYKCGQMADEMPFILRREDHLPPDPEVEEYVSKWLHAEKDEEELVWDCTGAPPQGLDAREKALRRGPTDFGVFAAECVRLEGQADLAILHAGTFRCDAWLPRQLRRRDLLETFQYDGEDAILLINLPRNAVEAALEHGRKHPGTGKYPQVSPDLLPDRAHVSVAIAKYLIANSEDGYDCVIARALNLPLPEFRKQYTARALPTYSIKAAIVHNAAKVGYICPAAVTGGVSDFITQFIRLSDHLMTFVPHPVEASINSLCHDGDLDNPDFQECRNALRSLLRQLPEVRSFHDMKPEDLQSPKMVRERFDASMGRMRELEKDLRDHVDSYRKQIPYATIFNFVAQGIGGWQM